MAEKMKGAAMDWLLGPVGEILLAILCFALAMYILYTLFLKEVI